jgi:hypothetical protein
MKSNWRRPSQSEAESGYIAMMRETYFCQTDSGILTIDYQGMCKENGLKYPQKERWFGYTAQMIERRIARGGDLPRWIEVRERRVAA